MIKRSPGRSAQQWSELIAQFRAGNDSDRAFCQRLNLNFHTFRKHKYANNRTKTPVSAGFTPVQVVSSVISGQAIKVHAGDDVVVELPGSADLVVVVQLVKALQRER